MVLIGSAIYGEGRRHSLAQNEDVQRITPWAAILFTRTLVGTVHGMNCTTMPELHRKFGYPLSPVLMGSWPHSCTQCSSGATGCNPISFEFHRKKISAARDI